jgi:hypothetical protein
MDFFDGRYKSGPFINLSGSNKSVSDIKLSFSSIPYFKSEQKYYCKKTREELLREATLEREKRERERRQITAATKIQSAFKSFLARKKLVSV